MTHDQYLAAWRVATEMCGWRRTPALADTVQRWWRTHPWLHTLTSDNADQALAAVELDIGRGGRPVPATLLAAFAAQRAHRPAPDPTPLTASDRRRNQRGMALCRWTLTERAAGRPPTPADIADQWNNPDWQPNPADAAGTVAGLLTGQRPPA